MNCLCHHFSKCSPYLFRILTLPQLGVIVMLNILLKPLLASSHFLLSRFFCQSASNCLNAFWLFSVFFCRCKARTWRSVQNNEKLWSQSWIYEGFGNHLSCMLQCHRSCHRSHIALSINGDTCFDFACSLEQRGLCRHQRRYRKQWGCCHQRYLCQPFFCPHFPCNHTKALNLLPNCTPHSNWHLCYKKS